MSLENLRREAYRHFYRGILDFDREGKTPDRPCCQLACPLTRVFDLDGHGRPGDRIHCSIHVVTCDDSVEWPNSVTGDPVDSFLNTGSIIAFDPGVYGIDFWINIRHDLPYAEQLNGLAHELHYVSQYDNIFMSLDSLLDWRTGNIDTVEVPTANGDHITEAYCNGKLLHTFQLPEAVDEHDLKVSFCTMAKDILLYESERDRYLRTVEDFLDLKNRPQELAWFQDRWLKQRGIVWDAAAEQKMYLFFEDCHGHLSKHKPSWATYPNTVRQRLSNARNTCANQHEHFCPLKKNPGSSCFTTCPKFGAVAANYRDLSVQSNFTDLHLVEVLYKKEYEEA